jgi:UDP-glucose 4-epimerase
MKILLTGASGFIGSRLLERLARVYGRDSVRLLTSKPLAGFDCIVYRSHRCLEIGAVDVSDIEAIVHAGAFTPKSGADANRIVECADNIVFTEQLLAMPFRRLGKIVNLSTLDVYASAELITEASPLGPVSLYGDSKLYCERMIRTFCREKKVGYQTLRIGHVYGPGEESYKKIIPVAISKVLSGDPIEIWGDGFDLRSFIYIDDVISAIVNALGRDSLFEVVNIVSGHSISIRDLVSMIVRVSGKRLEAVHKDGAGVRRDLVFDNSLLRSTLLEVETDFLSGLTAEYNHMKKIHEDNI